VGAGRRGAAGVGAGHDGAVGSRRGSPAPSCMSWAEKPDRMASAWAAFGRNAGFFARQACQNSTTRAGSPGTSIAGGGS
jgi:hypothetical protein